MTPEQARAAAKVLNQWAGNPELTVQYKYRGDENGAWCDVGEPGWDFNLAEYRIKPEPKTLWVVLADNFVLGTYHDKAMACEIARKYKNRHARVVKFVEQEE